MFYDVLNVSSDTFEGSQDYHPEKKNNTQSSVASEGKTSIPAWQLQNWGLYESQSCHKAINCLVSSDFPNEVNAQTEEWVCLLGIHSFIH